jgi:hypothetical protein
MSGWQRFVRFGLWCAILAAAPAPQAQARFEAVGRDAVAGGPGLEIITIRDNASNTCYALFTTAAVGGVDLSTIDPAAVQGAAAERDRRLADLAHGLEHSLATAVPAILGANVLKYEWEGQKAQADFEHVVRTQELDRLVVLMKQIVDASRFAVSGPAPCPARPVPSRGERP